jgi:hypothetical protein
MKNDNLPNPGSAEAVVQGCTCPVLDNAHGLGYLGDGKLFGWVHNSTCPLHGLDSQEQETQEMVTFCGRLLNYAPPQGDYPAEYHVAFENCAKILDEAPGVTFSFSSLDPGAEGEVTMPRDMAVTLGLLPLRPLTGAINPVDHADMFD